MKKQTYQVHGMHCTSCAQIISKKVAKNDGIESCNINFATKQAVIEYTQEEIPLDQINQSIQELWYQLETIHKEDHQKSSSSKQHDHPEISQSQLWIIISMVVTVFIMMGWEVGAYYQRWEISKTAQWFFHHLMPIFATYVFFWIDTRFVKATWWYIKHGVWNMDSLIGIGSTVAFVYSFVVTAFEDILKNSMDISRNFYESIVVVIWLSLVWRYIEQKQLAKNADAIKSLMRLQSKEVTIITTDGKETKIDLEQVKVWDTIVVKPGESIGVDWEVVYGISEVNESMITWEPLPVVKQLQDTVIWWTLNINGILHVKATKLWADSMLSKIIEMVSNAQNLKPTIQKVADTIAWYFVPLVLIVATITLLVWMIWGRSIAPDYRIRWIIWFVAIVSIACPCALWLATPLGIINGITRATKKGILVKNTNGLLALKDVKTIVFDKTWTITSGEPTVLLKNDLTEWDSKKLQILYSLEHRSNHPIARAISSKAVSLWISTLEVKDFKDLPWFGVQWTIDGKQYYAWNIQFIERIVSNYDSHKIDTIIQNDQTPVILFDNESLVEVYGITDTIKDGVKDTIRKLHALWIHTVMCTGDHTNIARSVANELGINEVIAQATPESKAEYIKALRKKSSQKVAMIGDGINDSIALSLADVSISMSNGSDVSIESSDLILLKGDLNKLHDAFRISVSTNTLIYQNLFRAFSYNIIGIPLAGGWLFPRFWWQLNPVFSWLFMATSSLFVVFNSMRKR